MAERANIDFTYSLSARGVASKAKRKPPRSVSLLSIGGMVGVTAGWLAGRKTA